MENVRQVQNEFGRLHGKSLFFKLVQIMTYSLIVCRLDFSGALNTLLKEHSTAFYIKATLSTQAREEYSKELRFRWSDVVDGINAIRANILHEQNFMKQIKFDKSVLSKIDVDGSIMMSSKLAYRLAKLVE